MGHTPVLLLEGARSVGKSTLLKEIAPGSGVQILDFDREDMLEFARANPTLVTDGGDLPVLIDEYQKEPRVLDWIKARLNDRSQPGMFVLAGSSSFDALPRGVQALTGRIQRLTVAPFTQTEIDGTDTRFLERAFEGDLGHTARAASTKRADYVARITRGGMPLALAEDSEIDRAAWFRGHTEQSLERDAGELRRLGRKAELPRLLTRIVGQTAGLLNVASAARDLDLSTKTAVEYIELLESLFLVSALPAWGTTVWARTVGAPKIHVVDSGIGAHQLNLSRAKLDRRDSSALTEFGHLLESFTVQEVLRQSDWLADPVTAGHWRTRDGDEVDLILERYDGAVLAFEVKAADHIEERWVRSLRKLRDRLGSSFVAGIAFHLGERGYTLDDRLHSVPLERLWT